MSRRCKIIVYMICGCIAILAVLSLIRFLFFTGIFIPKLQLKGASHIRSEVKEEVDDPGISAMYRFMDLSDEVIIEDNVDINKIGTYTRTYRLKKSGKQITREIEIVDTKNPALTLSGSEVVRVFQNSKYEESGFQAIDENDGDLTDQVQIKNDVDMKTIGNYTITYTVSDQSGNQTIVKRGVQICADPTAIRLHYAYDDYDNTAEEWWFRKSEDHKRTTAAKPEEFLRKYDAFFQGADEKTIYLTFDEGGNDITYIKEIARVLDENDVKATFFLTRNYIKNEADFINDLVAHGHVIGNHTWHHYDMTSLANVTNVDMFVREITETEKTYMEVTGKEMPKIFRFPKGGSSERALAMVKDLGYRTYKWSHAYYDYAQDVTKEEALKTLLDHYHNGAIYLLHPSNRGNYEAMDTFIKTMKDKGYDFQTVDEIL